MRRVGALLGILAGIAVAIAAFLPFVTKEGGNIATPGGSLPATFSGIDAWTGWFLLGVGALMLVSGLVLARSHSRIAAATMLLAGLLAAVAGIWALTSPDDVYVQVGARQVGEEPDAISLILDQFRTDVTAGVGAWVATIAGALAAALGIVLLVAPRGPREAPRLVDGRREVLGTDPVSPPASDTDTLVARPDLTETTFGRGERLEPGPSVTEERSEPDSSGTPQPPTSAEPVADVGPSRPEPGDQESPVEPNAPPSVNQEATRRSSELEDWR